MGVANVTFEPDCRNNWHTHHGDKGGGQILLCTAGRGWYQEWGKEAQALRPGNVAAIPTNVKHWHGAAKDSWFAHIAIEIPGENTSNEWLEPVTDEEYGSVGGSILYTAVLDQWSIGEAAYSGNIVASYDPTALDQACVDLSM